MGEEKNITERQVEFAQMIHDRKERRKDIAIILLAVALIVSIVVGYLTCYKINQKWLEAWQSYDYVSEETHTETVVDGKEGVANYIGNDGDIVNGENNSQNGNTKKNTP